MNDPDAKLKWKLYYDDLSTFSNQDGSWLDAPARGVLAINVAIDIVGRELERGNDYYLWWPGANQPWGVDQAGLWDFLREVDSDLQDERLGNHNYGDLIALGVKFGRSVSTPKWMSLFRDIMNDDSFPPKSALTAKEARDPGTQGR